MREECSDARRVCVSRSVSPLLASFVHRLLSFLSPFEHKFWRRKTTKVLVTKNKWAIWVGKPKPVQAVCVVCLLSTTKHTLNVLVACLAVIRLVPSKWWMCILWQTIKRPISSDKRELTALRIFNPIFHAMTMFLLFRYSLLARSDNNTHHLNIGWFVSFDSVFLSL